MPDLPVQDILHQTDKLSCRLSVDGQKAMQSEEISTRKQKNTIVSKIKNEYIKLQNNLSQQEHRSERMGAR
jgi:hypothetical protein